MLRLRRALPVDGPAIQVAHTAAIRVTCRSRYSAQDTEAWAAGKTPASYLEDMERRDVFVAERDGRIVGFGVLDVADREVRAVYVHPDAGSAGVGRALLRVLEDTARLRGLGEAQLDASLNALRFYSQAGWRRERDTIHTFPGGRDIACVRMTKRLPALRLAIREEAAADGIAVRAVNTAAFERDGEAALVDRLRRSGALALSLVAVLDDAVVGHVAFSAVEVDGATRVLGLGPMAVLPEYQRCGIGSRLVEEGLARLREGGAGAVVVLGHPDFYPRFGFVPASRFGLRYSDAVPDAGFMAAELVPGSLAGASAFARYRPEFAQLDE